MKCEKQRNEVRTAAHARTQSWGMTSPDAPSPTDEDGYGPTTAPAVEPAEILVAHIRFSLPFDEGPTLLADFETLAVFALCHAIGLRVLTEYGWTEYDCDDYRDDYGRDVTLYWFAREHVTHEKALAELAEAREVSDGRLNPCPEF